MEIFAWPLVVVVLGIAGMLVFRQPVSQLIASTKKVPPEGLETPEAQQQVLKEKEENPAVDEYFKGFESPMLAKAESGILENLGQRKITGASDRERVLVRALAATYVILQFEKILGSIWGSQLEMLRLLNVRPDGFRLSEAQSMYDGAKQQFPAYYEHYSFEQWMGYLQSFELIARDQARVLITTAGREFLKHLIAIGRSGPAHG